MEKIQMKKTKPSLTEEEANSDELGSIYAYLVHEAKRKKGMADG